MLYSSTSVSGSHAVYERCEYEVNGVEYSVRNLQSQVLADSINDPIMAVPEVLQFVSAAVCPD